MKHKNKLVLILFSYLLTALTGFLGAIPLRALRQKIGSLPYWSVIVASSLAFMAVKSYELSISFLCLGIMIGLFYELNQAGRSFISSSLLSVSVTFLLFVLGVFVSESMGVFSWRPFVAENLNNYMELIASRSEADPKEFIQTITVQVPSVLIMILSLGLFSSLAFEKKLAKWLQRPVDQKLIHNMYNFRMPDVCIWIGIVATLGSFYQWPENESYNVLKSLSTNLFNVFVFLYFFQGLAIISCFFKIFKISLFWRVFWLVFLVLQLFVAVSFLGFTDFWVNFRVKMAKHAAKAKKFNSK